MKGKITLSLILLEQKRYSKFNYSKDSVTHPCNQIMDRYILHEIVNNLKSSIEYETL